MKTFLTEKKGMKNKKLFCIFLLLICCTLVFADSSSTSTMNAVDGIKSIFKTAYIFFTSIYVKIICLGGIIWIGVKMITNRGEQKLIQSLVPWLIACILIGGASWFCDTFLGGNITNEASQLGGSSWL